jgi:dTDP-4-dehydrorhamnose 3,5-epimerase-like enzyme
MRINSCKLVNLPTKSDFRGNLCVVHGGSDIPFEIKRIYYSYGSKNEQRGDHGHKLLQQLIIAVAGSFDVVLNDGQNERSYSLDSPAQGLYVPAMMWRHINNFSNDAVCLVLASQVYDESDYYHSFEEFKRAAVK